MGPGFFSIQLNTNNFTMANGDQGVVQFTDMHSPASAQYPGDVACIWSIDGTANPPEYHSQCHAALMGRDVRTNDYAEIQGYQDFQEAGYLKMIFQLSWDSADGTYGVVAPDMYGLTHSSTFPGMMAPAGNIYGNWTQVSGSILGWGNSSTANFSKTNLWIALEAWNCEFDANMDCIGLNPGYWSWASTKPFVTLNWLTNESNNLSPITTFTPAMKTTGLPALQCPGWNGCYIEYTGTAP
jgi:hypothetical protein